MGELHLDIIIDRLKEFSVDVTEAPQVAYKAITSPVNHREYIEAVWRTWKIC